MAPESFEQAMASKPSIDQKLTDAQWYVVLVAQVVIADPRFDSKVFRFCIDPPNPELVSMWERKVEPLDAAMALFASKH